MLGRCVGGVAVCRRAGCGALWSVLTFLLAAVCTFFPLAVCCAVVCAAVCVYLFRLSLSLGGGRCGVLLACSIFLSVSR